MALWGRAEADLKGGGVGLLGDGRVEGGSVAVRSEAAGVAAVAGAEVGASGAAPGKDSDGFHFGGLFVEVAVAGADDADRLADARGPAFCLRHAGVDGGGGRATLWELGMGRGEGGAGKWLLWWLWWWLDREWGGEREGLLGGEWETGLEGVVVCPAAAFESLFGVVGAAGVTVHEPAGFVGASDALEGAVNKWGEPGDVVGEGVGEQERVGDGAGVGQAASLENRDAGVGRRRWGGQRRWRGRRMGP